MSHAWVASLLGLLVGLVLGLTGAGGGVLAVPALVLGLGFSLLQAVPVALFAVGGAAALGAYHGLLRQQVRYRAALLMAVAGSLVAPLGLWLAHLADKPLLTGLFACVMLVVAGRMYLSSRAPSHAGAAASERAARRALPCRIDRATGRLHWTGACALTIAGIGVAAGFCTGLLGVGGGFVIVPALRRFSDVRTHEIVATSLLAIALIAFASVLTALARGTVVTFPGMLFIAGSLAGMVLGRANIERIPAHLLLRGFSVLMLLVALCLLGQALT